MNKKIIILFALSLITVLFAFTSCTTAISDRNDETSDIPESIESTSKETQPQSEEIESVYSSFTGNIIEYPFYDTDKIHGISSANAEIKIISDENEYSSVTYSDNNGNFEFDHLPLGEYNGMIKKGITTKEFSFTVDDKPLTESLELTVEYDDNANKYVYSEKTTVNEHDLNGDGIKEEIYYESTKFDSYDYPIFPKLHINGKDFSYLLDNRMYASDFFAVIDIDNRDDKLQLVINDYGPSTDFSCEVYEYNGTDLISVGMMEGIVENSEWGSDTYICGDGNIISTRRLYNFQTWYAYERWTLSFGKLTEEKPDFYYTVDGYGSDLTTLMDMTLYTEADLKSKLVDIPKGTKLHLSMTDNEKWVRASDPNGNVCWIYEKPESFGDIETNGTTVSIFDLFDGLCMAD